MRENASKRSKVAERRKGAGHSGKPAGKHLNLHRNRQPNRHRGSSIDDFLEEEGVFQEFQARAIKEVIAWQLAEALK